MNSLNTIKAKDIMHTEVISINEDSSVAELRDLLKKHSISGVPVLKSDGQAAGVVSIADVARFAASSKNDRVVKEAEPGASDFYTFGDTLECEYMEGYHTETAREARVSDIMTPDVFGVQEESSLSEVASLMVEKKIHRVIVLSSRGVAGIISSLDVMKELIR